MERWRRKGEELIELAGLPLEPRAQGLYEKKDGSLTLNRFIYPYAWFTAGQPESWPAVLQGTGVKKIWRPRRGVTTVKDPRD